MNKYLFHWIYLVIAAVFLVVPGRGQKIPIAGPDLTITLTGPQQAVVIPNTSLTGVKVQIANTGRRDAANFDVSLDLSETINLSGWTGQVGRQHIAKLPQGISMPVLFTNARIPADTPLKALYLIARVDSQNTVAEAREDNNTANLAALAQMKISTAFQATDSNIVLYIKGAGFGSSWGNNQICFNGSAANIPSKPAGNWTDTQIAFQPQGLTTGLTYSVTIAQNGTSVSNAFSLFVAAAIGYPNIQQGPPGTAIILNGQGFGSSQGGRILKLGNAAVTAISSWSDLSIACAIPSGLAPGKYTFSLWQNGQCISKSWVNATFTIQ